MPIYSGHMPTITPEPAPFSASESHKARQMAKSFGLDAERYDRARPSYPQAMVGQIIAASPGRDVLDVGIGTGISARPFQAAGCRVTGVDVDDRMAEFARRQGFEVEVASFEEWRPGGRMFDLVIAGQAWHWVDPVAGALKAAQVLRPSGGWLCSGTCSSSQPSLRRPSPRYTGRFSPARRSSEGRPGGWPRTRARQGGRRYTGSGRVWPPRTVAVRLGAALHPGRMAGPGPDVRWPQPVPTGQAGRTAGGHRRRHRRRWRPVHDELHRRGRHRCASRCLTQTAPSSGGRRGPAGPPSARRGSQPPAAPGWHPPPPPGRRPRWRRPLQGTE